MDIFLVVILILLIIILLLVSLFAFQKLQSQKVQPEQSNELKRLESGINSLNIGFVVLDQNLKIISINSTAKRLLCFAESGQTRSGVLLDPLAISLECNLEDIEKQLVGVFDIRKNLKESLEKISPITKDIQFRDLFLNILISPIVTLEDTQLSVSGQVVLIEDITSRKVLEKSKDEFFSIASHELRTPLTSIRGNAALIQDHYKSVLKKEQDLKEMVDDIYSGSVRLIEIVNDFLDTSRLEQGRMKFEISKISLNQLFDEVSRELSSIAKEKKLYLKFPKKLLPVTINADKNRLKQILINLIGNSFKFTEKGGVEVSVSLQEGMARILVADTGIGIAEDKEKLLFRKFEQAAASQLTRDLSHGTGLGLYISKLMIEKMGGEIWLEKSELGEGTTFGLSIPQA